MRIVVIEKLKIVSNTQKLQQYKRIRYSETKRMMNNNNEEYDHGGHVYTQIRRQDIPIVQPDRDPVIISIYIPKGGVGKSTTTFSLCYTLAERGYNVLAVDCDSQRDLSKMMLKGRYSEDTQFGGDYSAYINRPTENGTIPNRTLYQMLQGMSEGPAYELKSAVPEHIYNGQSGFGGSLHLLAGHIDMDCWNAKLSFAELMCHLISSEARSIGGPYHAVMNCARLNSVKADIIIVDLPPVKSSFTRNILMASNYFISPTKADFCSIEALNNLFDRLTIHKGNDATGQNAQNSSWLEYSQTWLTVKTANNLYPYPKTTPKFLGYIVNDYPVRDVQDDKLASNIRMELSTVDKIVWMDRTDFASKAGRLRLIHASLLNGNVIPLTIDDAVYDKLNLTYRCLLSKIKSFHQLQSLSHYCGIQVPFQEEHHHVTSVNRHFKTLDCFAWVILALINGDNPDGRILAPRQDPRGGHCPPTDNANYKLVDF